MNRERLDASRNGATGQPNGYNGSNGSVAYAGKGKATKPKELEVEPEVEPEALAEEPEPLSPTLWPDPVDGKALVSDLRNILYQHVVMTEEQEMAAALWVIHAHAHAACRRSPILAITAPEENCGKSHLLGAISYLVPRPFTTTNATAPKICRHTNAGNTIVADECETWMHESKADGMRGLLNSSWMRGGTFDRVAASFSTWAPFCIGLNGHLHSTTESRCIIIRLERKLKGEKVALLQELDFADAENQFNVLRRKAARWAYDNVAALKKAEPVLPEEFDNRNADNWQPLLAIADATGWSNKARKAALMILGEKLQEVSVGGRLMGDIELLFKKLGSPLTSQQLCDGLNQLETSPWGTYHRGAPLNPIKLAQILKPYGIKPGEIDIGRRATGYKLAQFVRAFERYGQP